jgi:DNA-binding response OmpR family regulator
MPDAIRAERMQLMHKRAEALQAELRLCIREIVELAGAAPGDETIGTRSRVQRPTESRLDSDASTPPLADEMTFCIRWAGKVCHLGYTIPFKLFARLARRPNVFISHSQLIEDVWLGACRSDETIRSEVRHLRLRLRSARMSDLAAAIKGQDHHYGLILQPIV